MAAEDDREDTTVYNVVVNHEEQYSIWPVDREIPRGWKSVGKRGSKAECLGFVKEVWTDMRPLSLRKAMEREAKERAERKARGLPEYPPPQPPPPPDPRDNLVQWLAEGDHPVEASLRPEKTVAAFKDRIDRGYVHIKFTDTRGGTELGVRLDPQTCNLSGADFEKQTGTVHLVGGLTLNYVKVRCVADIDLETLSGGGHLEIFEG